MDYIYLVTDCRFHHRVEPGGLEPHRRLIEHTRRDVVGVGEYRCRCELSLALGNFRQGCKKEVLSVEGFGSSG